MKIAVLFLFIIWMLLTFVVVFSILGLIIIIPWMEFGDRMLTYILSK